VPGFSTGVPPHLYRYGAAEYQDELIRAARSRLHRAVPVNRQTRAAIHTRIVVGDTTAEIARIVDAIGADLLVVGVPKRGVISRSLFGTTAARLLKATRVPVLAVPGLGAAIASEESASRQPAA
jgi:nucleotide-binding universal stress UspA family protein